MWLKAMCCAKVSGQAIALTLLIMASAACTSGGAPGAQSQSISSSSEASPAQGNQPFVERCDDSVYGQMGGSWRERALNAGPIAFVSLPLYATAPARWFKPAASYEDAAFAKVLAVVRSGHEVSVTIPDRFRDELALAYGAGRDRLIEDGEAAVTFHPCGPGESQYGDHPATQFAGGFLVTGPLCAWMEVSADGQPASTVPLSFGAGTRCTS